MQTTVDIPTAIMPTVSEADAQHTACDYVAAHIDPSFEVVSGDCYYSKPLGRAIWRFFVRCKHGPVGAIRVDAQTGEVIRLTDDEIRVVYEKAAIFVARQQGVLPTTEQGYVLAEYARRQADSYLGTEVSLFYSATNGVFIPLGGSPPGAIWQFSIQVRLPQIGVLGIMGAIDVDARTGEVIQLTNQQIKRIRERADALVEFRTPRPEGIRSV